MRRLTTKLAAVGAGAVILTTAAACGGDPSPVAEIKSLSGTSTSVALDSGFVSALKSLKVTPAPVGTAKISSAGVASFPITGGDVKVYKKGDVTPYVQGEIDHNGSGLSLTAGGTKVSLTNFVIDPGNNSKLTGDVAVNGKSAAKGAKLFDLNGNTLKTPTVSNGVATLTGTEVKLSSDAAALLNKTFKITALKGGLLIGIATIKAK
ncbi:hypothetical protein [Jatrophihabitans fulvus]